ncbi:glycosyltransferase [Synechococcus sp. RSCCF101]|uniref:glycosyltransferase n=1 Tax=Synechococcus sp. RSCCF101 TaxID=2511069 RepID=UPI001248DDD4|nr:glycosyltransferase [Synechococcus sp. RSCCF101]QEY32374.1 glycosyltransferase [Synechococcus sp. RSCCF101]
MSFSRESDAAISSAISKNNQEVIVRPSIMLSSINDLARFPAEANAVLSALEELLDSCAIFAKTATKYSRSNHEICSQLIRRITSRILYVKPYVVKPLVEITPLCDVVSSILEQSEPAGIQVLGKSIATLIHCCDRQSQCVLLEVAGRITRSTSARHATSLREHLFDYLNLPEPLLELTHCSLPSAKQPTERKSNSTTDNAKRAIRCILSESSARKARLTLADLRRARRRPCSATRDLVSDSVTDKYEECVQCLLSPSSKKRDDQALAFAKICLYAKFVGRRQSMLATYQKLRQHFAAISSEAHLVFLACSGLDYLLISDLRLKEASDLLQFALAGGQDGLYRYFSMLMTRRLACKSIKQTQKGDISVVIASTDREGAERFLFLSLLSVMAQSSMPEEVFVFIDPVFGNHTHSMWLKDEISSKRFLDAWDLDQLAPLRGIPIRVFVNDTIRGQYYARNTAAAMASTTYIANQDDDDFSDFTRLHSQIESLGQGGLISYGAHVRISEEGSFQHDSRDFFFKGDGIASLCTYVNLVRLNPFLEVRSRGDVEFRERIILKYGSESVRRLNRILLLMRGASQSVSSRFETMHSKAFAHFYDEISSGHAFC